MSERRLAGLPALYCRPAQGEAEKRPLIILFQRFMIAKELDSNLAYILARAGYSVVCPQAALHGVGDDAQHRLTAFWSILRHTLDTLPGLLVACQREKLGDVSRSGVVGTSMGGFAVLGAMARYPGIQAGAAYMASGYFTQAMEYVHSPLPDAWTNVRRGLAAYDVVNKVSQLAKKPLFLWHGEQDAVVRVNETQRLAEALHQVGSKMLTCVIDPQAGHKITQPSVDAGVAFLQKYLPASD